MPTHQTRGNPRGPRPPDLLSGCFLYLKYLTIKNINSISSPFLVKLIYNFGTIKKNT